MTPLRGMTFPPDGGIDDGASRHGPGPFIRH
jgi:hypothetical protein